MPSKKKIINDPVFGFITIPSDFLYELIQHPIFQRLQRIRQLGLASFVYPGAQHTRLHHSIGAMYLMGEAIHNLRFKGHDITPEEAEGALACILLHDIGHGPFSHVLEHTLTNGIYHEEFSLGLMEQLNEEMGGRLDVALQIFKDEYPKRFLHQLVSGQLDVDRLDYLRRDSFFTGVTEGNIGSARIIKMLDLVDDRLVVEAKGIYSIENFLMARRLMYWQVYLHKTAVAAEQMLIQTLRRAKELTDNGEKLFTSPAFAFFLNNKIDRAFYERNKEAVLQNFVLLDDNDIWCSLKVWANHSDLVLSRLSEGMVDRKLFKIEILSELPSESKINEYKGKCINALGVNNYEADFLYSVDSINTKMYDQLDDKIEILYSDGAIKDISSASDMLNIELLSKKVEKYYFAYLRI